MFAKYEKVFDYLFDLNSIGVDNDLERKIRLCFNKLSKFKKRPVVFWLFTTDISMNLNGICKVILLSTDVKFSRFDRCWKKNKESAKK